MNKILLIFISLGFIIRSTAQIQSDIKDPFTGVRTVLTKFEQMLGGNILFAGLKEFSNDSTICKIGVLTKQKLLTTETQEKEKGLFLLTSVGEKMVLPLAFTTISDAVTTSYYYITELQLKSMVSTKITHVKLVGDKGHYLMLELPKGKQGIFSSISNTLLTVH